MDVVPVSVPPDTDVSANPTNYRRGLKLVLVKLLSLGVLGEGGHLLMEELLAVTFN